VFAPMPVLSAAANVDVAGQVQQVRDATTLQLRTQLEPFTGPARSLELRTAEGAAAAEIVRHAREWDADLLVMGTHGRSGFDRFALGSVTEKVLRKAVCPVLTLPPGAQHGNAPASYRHVLCPVDFCEGSAASLELGVALAAREGAVVTVLHVVETLGTEEGTADVNLSTLRRLQCENARGDLEKMVAIHAKGAAVPIEQFVSAGRPHREILRWAAEQHADLIVMSTQGRGPIDLTLFGSTTNQVVRRATCPVVTVRMR
jgi:nucleotide-binding universal stress UspA family protein